MANQSNRRTLSNVVQPHREVLPVCHPETTPNPRIIRRGEVERITGLSRSGVYEKVSPDSVRYDESFPKSVRLGERAVGWVESEVYAWVQARIDAAKANAMDRK